MSAAVASLWLATMTGHWIWTGRASLGRWWSRIAWLSLACAHVVAGVTGVQVGALTLIALSLFVESVAEDHEYQGQRQLWWRRAMVPVRIGLLLGLVLGPGQA